MDNIVVYYEWHGQILCFKHAVLAVVIEDKAVKVKTEEAEDLLHVEPICTECEKEENDEQR